MTREEMANVAEYVADDHIHLRCLNSHGQKLLAIATELRRTCEWKSDGDGVGFNTACGHNFYFDGDGGPIENKQQFCGYCGGALIEVPYTPEPDEDEA